MTDDLERLARGLRTWAPFMRRAVGVPPHSVVVTPRGGIAVTFCWPRPGGPGRTWFREYGPADLAGPHQGLVARCALGRRIIADVLADSGVTA